MLAMAGKECVAIASDRRLGVQLVRSGSSAYPHRIVLYLTPASAQTHIIDDSGEGCDARLQDAR